MDGWGTLGAALISAAVSLAVALGFRWWEKRKVEWFVTGEAHQEYASGQPTGLIRANLEVHNVGDGDAFNVRSVRCNGAEYDSWEQFEAGHVTAGGSLPIVMRIQPDKWDSAWFEITYVSTPTRLNRTIRRDRQLLNDLLGEPDSMPPRIRN